MGLVNLIERLCAANKLAELAEQVSRRSEAAVWRRVEQRLCGMGPNEMIGYIRARAAGVVDVQVGAVQTDHPEIDAILRPRLVQQASDAVAERVMKLYLADGGPIAQQRAA
jgi:hypothetical protein